MRIYLSNTCASQHRMRGVSLIELLIASTIGLFLISGLITVFSASKRSSDLSTEMASMQESMRFVMNVIASDIRSAGHQGCLDSNGQPVTNIANNPPTADLRDTAISGSVVQADNSWLPVPALGSGPEAFVAPTVNAAIPGTHALAVQFGAQSTALRGPMVVGGLMNVAGPLLLDGDVGLAVNDLAIISTCEGGELFRVSSVATDGNGDTTVGHAATHNSRGSFNEVYGTIENIGQTRVLPLKTHIYYVADTGRDTGRGDDIKALYQQSMPFNDAANPPVMLAEGVDDMRLIFVVDDGAGRLRHLNATDADFDPSRVLSVKVALMMSSRDHIHGVNDSTTYVMAGTSISASDTPSSVDEYLASKRFRMVFNTTVKVRNRRSAS